MIIPKTANGNTVNKNAHIEYPKATMIQRTRLSETPSGSV